MAGQRQGMPIYPQYCFKAAPTHDVWCFLRTADIPLLRKYVDLPDLHFYKNLPIKFIRIVGLIVAVDDYANRRVYTIDDSSGVNIECILNLQDGPSDPSKIVAPQPPIPPEYAGLQVGHVVDVKGTITDYHRARGIKIARMKQVPTTEQELSLWERRYQFRTTILDQPWVMSQQDVLRCLKEAERADTVLAASKRIVASRSRRVKHEQESDPYKIKREAARTAAKRICKSETRPALFTHEELSIREVARRPRTTTPVLERDPNLTREDPYSITAKRRAGHAARSRDDRTEYLATDREQNEDPDRIPYKSREPSPQPTIPRREETIKDGRIGEPRSKPFNLREERSVANPEPEDPYAIKTNHRQMATGRSQAHGTHVLAEPLWIIKPAQPCSVTNKLDKATEPASVAIDPFSIKKSFSPDIQENAHDASDPFRIGRKGARRAR